MNTQQTPPTTGHPVAPLLRLHLFGRFRVSRDGCPEPTGRWPRLTAQALVKLLALTPGHRLHREQIMDLCWPDTDPHAAAGNLRVALHAARRALEPELAPRAASSYLVSDGAMLSLDPATVWVDTDHAEEAAESALESRDPDALKDALALFTGELLPEDRYLSWTEPRRARLTALTNEMRLGLASAHLERGALQEATATAEHVLRSSPAEEAAHRILIDAYIRQGLRRRAVGQYHLCREALAAELGVPPGPETERLHRVALATARKPGPARVALPAPLQSPDVAPLRGRDELLHQLLATGGRPVRILTGEAGVGKTRLVAEAARLAAASGSAVLWGAGHDAEGHTPYGVFAEALDGWLAERDVAERARVGSEYPELAAFLPSLGQVRSFGDRSPEEERDRLFGATSGLLAELAAVQPVLLVLDDLHAADSGSYQLLSHLARHASRPGFPLRVLVTYRAEELADSGPRVVDLTALLRQPQVVHVMVQRLDREACLAVARDVAPPMGGDASPAGAGTDHAERFDRVWELSLGNPLFAGELARNLGDDGPEGVAPDGVRQLVAEKLARLDGNTRRVVEALSVGGAETALSELLDVAADGLHPPLSGAAAIAALDEAIGAALIEERTVVVTGRHETGIAFRHPLVRLTCYERLSAVRRRHLHGAFAQAVRRRRPDAVDTLASHFARADDVRAAEYLRLAAERAAALYANDTADRYYRDLIARLDVDAGRARLAHAQVLRSMGHFEQAVGALRPALAEFERLDDHDNRVLAAALLAEMLVRTGSPAPGLAILRQHPVTEETTPEPTAGHFLTLSVILSTQGHYDDGCAAAERALAAADEVTGHSSHGLKARAFVLQASNLGLAGHFDLARAAGDRALPPAEASGDPTLLGSVLSMLRENARRAGRLREAIDRGERALGLAERSGGPAAAAFERANLAELRLLLEEPEQACALAEAAVAGAEPAEAWCLPYALAALARTRWAMNEAAAAEDLLDRAESVATTLGDRRASHAVRTARAELALHTGHPEAVLRVLDRFGEEAPVLAAWGELLSGRAESARQLALAEVSRAERTGEHLAEVEARVALGASLTVLAEEAEGAGELARAESLAERLPYPAGTSRAAWARALLRDAGHA
ncbi:ATP-binding protein [Streptomyces poriferorum]|uniref:AAA family ATPase n=1 Tax=Streptomyces poriferorum TaxID=2798799 RepID=A0ABY9J312_9ACTN|nr:MULTISPECIES: AAA family ATPase [unclassified Streptomyces]MDP5310116.1 AAA family ATPase [Streptomyces sp. Alt4]WLQ60719.1 AAA family ATPase [Streptomyces sp. Alt2]